METQQMTTNGTAATPASQAIVSLPAFEVTADIEKLLNTTKQEDLVEVESDVWKGEKSGDSLFGVYLGTRESNFQDKDTGAYAPWHFFAVKSSDGSSVVIKRMLSQAIVDRGLETVKAPSPVKIVFEGESKTAGGQKLNLYTVSIPRVTKKK